MNNKIINYKNMELKRISFKTVKKIIDNPSKYEGLVIYLLPVNANYNSPWINGFDELLIDNIKYMDSIDYYNYISEYKYYNCIEDLGSYLKFYIKNK